MSSKKTLSERFDDVIFNSELPWLKLDLTYDFHAIKEEILTFKRYENQSAFGWQGLAYRGISIEKMRPHTNYGYEKEDDVPYKWTELSEAAPTLKKFLEERFPKSKFYRIKVNKLLPGGRIWPHSDSRKAGLGLTEHSPFAEPDPYRIKYLTIALDWPSDIEFYLGGNRLPIREGDFFLLDFSQSHEVYNRTKRERVSIIITGDFSEDDNFKKLVVDSYEKYSKQEDHNSFASMGTIDLLTRRLQFLLQRLFWKLTKAFSA